MAVHPWRRNAQVTAGLLMLAGPIQTAGFEQGKVVRMAESGIRRVATSKPLPDYPPDAIARKRNGVAVAAITSGADGRVTSVTVLEAPDESIGAAVRTALLKWQIPPTTVSGRPELYGAQGKITFYFQLTGGRGRVLNPEEMPGGPRPEPKEGPPARAGGPATRPTGSAPVVTHDDPAPDLEIGEPELQKLIASARPIVLDIRERDEFVRGHRGGAINIPRDELAIRAYIEIDRTRPVVIDCSQNETSACRQAANQLLRGPKIARVLIFLP